MSVSMVDWLEERSQKLINKINELIERSDEFHNTGKGQFSEAIDSQIDILYHRMNIIDDKQKRILQRGITNG